MSEKAKISIIIPAYNVSPYLSACMESCISQTLYDIEIIAVDDGSTDDTGKILDDYARLDPRVTVIHKENGGLSSARNAGMKAAHGEWIMFLDSDDYFSQNACERIWREVHEAPTDIIAFGTTIFPEYPNAGSWYPSVLHIQTRRVHGFSPKAFFGKPGSMPFVWRQAFSAELLRETGIMFDESIRYGEDLIFQMEIFPFAEEVSYISDHLYNYRWIRPGSLMENINADFGAKIRKHLVMTRIITRYWSEKGLLAKYGRDYLIWMLDFLTAELRKVEDESERKQISDEILEIMREYGLRKYWIRLSPRQKVEYAKKMLILNGRI